MRSANARTFQLRGAENAAHHALGAKDRTNLSSHGTHGSHNGHAPSAPPVLLSIAGFDPSCGAGIAADLKTFAAHNCYGVAAITALTVQSTQGVRDVHPTPSAVLRAQLDALAQDVPIAAVKVGMLANRANAAAVAEFLDSNNFVHVVLDPVSRPTAGNAELLDAPGLKFVRDELLRRSTVLTPNIPEAEFLTGLEVKDVNGMKAAAQKLVEMGARAVIVTGGHLEKPTDVLCEGSEVLTFGGDHVRSPNTHGSGCTFSSAIAAQLAGGLALRQAVILAKAYVTKAIEKSFQVGKGAGPLNQLFRFYQEPPARGVHEVPQHGMHPAAEPATH
ncbi:MAG TPA: bifunctional hydroxymethylpyrimidine kinase/phosphomethylpyrimidine kinase [Candidatus Acidoferrales bacterium]|nr:bifunctional hydroxymethylpyrimidine kinase/phosphomethylpyrimidine kinase [Candidatus Acidoferrales bacterium]